MIPRRVVSSVASLAASFVARGQRWLPIPNVRAIPIYVREAIVSAEHAASGWPVYVHSTSVLSPLAPKFRVRRRVNPVHASFPHRFQIVVSKRWCPEAREQQHDAPVPRVRKAGGRSQCCPHARTDHAGGSGGECGFG